MGEYPCDRCEDGMAAVAMWDDNIHCGRIDVICEECYENGERIHRPIEPPYNDDGELYWHLKRVDCPLCDAEHIVKINDTISTCPRMAAEGKDHIDRVFDVPKSSSESVSVTYKNEGEV